MRLTMRTNLAMRTLMFCAVNTGRVVRKSEVAAAVNASENHLAQVIHKLSQAGFISTIRGRTGGLKLGMVAENIRVGTVIRSLEASVPFTECMEGGPQSGTHCPLDGVCRLKCAFSDALGAFYTSLDTLTLADLVRNNAGLERVLKVV